MSFGIFLCYCCWHVYKRLTTKYHIFNLLCALRICGKLRFWYAGSLNQGVCAASTSYTQGSIKKYPARTKEFYINSFYFIPAVTVISSWLIIIYYFYLTVKIINILWPPIAAFNRWLTYQSILIRLNTIYSTFDSCHTLSVKLILFFNCQNCQSFKYFPTLFPFSPIFPLIVAFL